MARPLDRASQAWQAPSPHASDGKNILTPWWNKRSAILFHVRRSGGYQRLRVPYGVDSFLCISAQAGCWGVVLVPNAKRKVERKAAKPKQGAAPDSSVGHALRSVYEKAVQEEIPQEMLDLLGKLK